MSYTQLGTYTHSLGTTISGCDSIATLNLNIANYCGCDSLLISYFDDQGISLTSYYVYTTGYYVVGEYFAVGSGNSLPKNP